MNTSAQSSYQTPCLLFDNECILCKRFKESLERIELEQEIHFYPIQDEAIYQAFEFLDKDEVFKEIHLIVSDNPPEILKGSAAISYLSMLNPLVSKFSWLVESEVGKKASNLFYRSVNKYRESLRKQCPKCRVKSNL